MFKFLLPKEEKYFEDFNIMVAAVTEMADMAKEFFNKAVYDDEIILKITALEKRCDEISQKVIKKLNRSFLTPFDREDIYDLIHTLEKLSDSIYAAVTRVKVYNFTQHLDVADKLLQIAGLQLKEIHLSIVEHKLKQTDGLKNVKDYEEEADNIYREAISLLFREEKDAIDLMRKKAIIDALETVTDRCQNIAAAVMTIALKNN
ncbi:MAG: DUF47 family protein [Ignavibacteriales bacterium]|nr:DUF47 family protein [Ignavibacteriales bacterium]